MNVKQMVVDTISEVLQLDAEEISILNEDVAYKRLKKWTSARHPEIIVALEDEFDLEIEERDIAKLVDVPTIVEYMSQHAVVEG